ncbi:UNVERIFIED_CONTAM: Retrovirus-related Pol polyprotein from transposon 17.6 [Sesamum indicum]
MGELETLMIDFLWSNVDMFAWSLSDCSGINPEVIVHRLNVDPAMRPVQQKKRSFSAEKNRLIQKRSLFKGPLLSAKINVLVDSTAGFELFSMMDAYQGYHQIYMPKEYREKTLFITGRGIYCYNVMPFGLKNAGATYQRLVNRMFKELIGRTMKVYVDDMLVKNNKAYDHLEHLKQAFDLMRSYGMKLNPTKCTFGVGGGKFLGYMVSERGIEANSEKIEVVMKLRSPTMIKG